MSILLGHVSLPPPCSCRFIGFPDFPDTTRTTPGVSATPQGTHSHLKRPSLRLTLLTTSPPTTTGFSTGNLDGGAKRFDGAGGEHSWTRHVSDR